MVQRPPNPHQIALERITLDCPLECLRHQSRAQKPLHDHYIAERSPEQEQQDYGLFYRAAYLYTYVLSGVSIVLSGVSMPVLMPLSYAWEILASLFRSGKGEV
jgi:hypothetical protein